MVLGSPRLDFFQNFMSPLIEHNGAIDNHLSDQFLFRAEVLV
jgi:hypothetical protein